MDRLAQRTQAVTEQLEAREPEQASRGLTVWQMGGKVRCGFQAPGLPEFAIEDHSATWPEGWRNGPFVVGGGPGVVEQRGGVLASWGSSRPWVLAGGVRALPGNQKHPPGVDSGTA